MRRIVRLGFTFATLSTVAVSLITHAPAQDEMTPRVTVENIAKNYRKLVLLTKKPVYVDPILAMLCRGADPSEVKASQKVSGPHAHTAVRIFMNPLAAGAFKRTAKTYPVGAVIVKEKTGLVYNTAPGYRDGNKTANGVGGMIKRAPGYDPAHGDWEYFYTANKTKAQRGKITSCVGCHERAARTDHVYGSWGTHHPPLKPLKIPTSTMKSL